MLMRQERRSCKLQLLVIEEDAPIGRVSEKLQDLFRFSAEEPATGFELKFNLLSNYLCCAAISDIARAECRLISSACPFSKLIRRRYEAPRREPRIRPANRNPYSQCHRRG